MVGEREREGERKSGREGQVCERGRGEGGREGEAEQVSEYECEGVCVSRCVCACGAGYNLFSIFLGASLLNPSASMRITCPTPSTPTSLHVDAIGSGNPGPSWVSCHSTANGFHAGPSG